MNGVPGRGTRGYMDLLLIDMIPNKYIPMYDVLWRHNRCQFHVKNSKSFRHFSDQNDCAA